MMMGQGEGTNNFSKFMNLKLLIIFSIEKGCKELNVFGDSMAVINWSRGTQRCLNIRLILVLEEVKSL